MKKPNSRYYLSVVLAILQLLCGPAAAAKTPWSGEWRRVDSQQFDQATVQISGVTARNFKFSFLAVSGAHVGEMQGSAEIKGNQAFFSEPVTARSFLS